MRTEYDLPLNSGGASCPVTDHAIHSDTPPLSIVSANALWFCRLRWVVVVMLLLLYALNYLPRLAGTLGLIPPGQWPLMVVIALTFANIIFWIHAWHVRNQARASRINLWAQIFTDLVLLTVVIHYSGELQPVVSFAYLFHIVLACIFFNRRESFVVVALALALYSLTLLLETQGVVPRVQLFTAGSVAPEHACSIRMPGTLFFSLFCLVIWYLTSKLSDKVRERDDELSDANRYLLLAQEAKAKHMLRTTHELKAPFAAIQANVQLLTKGYCGALPQEAMEVLDRVEQRCRRLTNEIQEMLQLANLRSAKIDALHWRKLNIADELNWSVQQIQPLAIEHHVKLELDIAPVFVYAVEEQLRMLFSNLLANAINYSYPDGEVRVTAKAGPNGGAEVSIRDHGIGIEPEKLTHIFDEYYRTDRAAQHNKTSSGLGLAIVQHIAETHGLRMRVSSEIDAGTEFKIDFPPVRG